MTGYLLADVASKSAPLVLVLLLLVVSLLLFRAVCGSFGIALRKPVVRRLDVVIAVSLLLFAVSVYWRFKVIG